MNNMYKRIIKSCNSMINDGVNAVTNDEAEEIASIALNVLEQIHDFVHECDINDVEYKEEYLMRNQYACEAAIETFSTILEEVSCYFEN